MDCLKLRVSNWNEDVNVLNKCLNYRMYKTEHKIESYFVKLSPVLCSYYNRFNCMNHRLPIEFGRFVNIERANKSVVFVIQANKLMTLTFFLSVSFSQRTEKSILHHTFTRNQML